MNDLEKVWGGRPAPEEGQDVRAPLPPAITDTALPSNLCAGPARCAAALKSCTLLFPICACWAFPGTPRGLGEAPPDQNHNHPGTLLA